MNKEEVEKLSKEEKLTLVREGKLFCVRTFIAGIVRKMVNFIFEVILSREFIVFAIFSIAFYKTSEPKLIWHWVCYAAVGVVFILAQAIRVLLKEKTTLDIKANANVSAAAALNAAGDLNKAASQIIEGVKK